jgi:hypothetical protein
VIRLARRGSAPILPSLLREPGTCHDVPEDIPTSPWHYLSNSVTTFQPEGVMADGDHG